MTTPATPSSPADLQARIADLKKTSHALSEEVRMLEGKLANRNPQLLAKLRNENQELALRQETLLKTLLALMIESYQGRNADEVKLHYECLKQSAVDYFTKNKVDPELWKSIES
jgi:hypothetical protein